MMATNSHTLHQQLPYNPSTTNPTTNTSYYNANAVDPLTTTAALTREIHSIAAAQSLLPSRSNQTNPAGPFTNKPLPNHSIPYTQPPPQAQPQPQAPYDMSRKTSDAMQGVIPTTQPPQQAQPQPAAKPASNNNAAAEKSGPRKVRFNVGNHYQVLEVIGEGAYGVVVSAIHKPTKQKVAIKKIMPFDHVLFALRTLRELKLLKYFSDQAVSENLITVLDIIKPTSYDGFKEVYLVQELLETDLHRVIRTQDLSDDHCQYFLYQTCRALKALHSAEIVHRDLKPSNLLLNANCDLKVCDFGLARSTQTALPGGENGIMTEYVATRWYRAPEVMLSFKQYSKAIDVWSLGCILAEMLTGKPLFPGRDYHHQLSLILEVLGTPTMDEFVEITSRRSREYLRALPFKKKKTFEQLYPMASPAAIDFLYKTLTFDPKKRYTVEQCLAHPYLEAYHDPEDEPNAAPLAPGFFDFDLKKDDLTKEELKGLLYDEIMTFRPQA